MPNPRELHKDLAHPYVSAPVILVPLTLNVTETADVTIQGFKATRDMRLLRASYQQTADATAVTSYTCQLKNGATALTSALDIKALAATAGADFAGILATAASDLKDGDVLTVVFDETGGTVTAPGRVTILLELLLLE